MTLKKVYVCIYVFKAFTQNHYEKTVKTKTVFGMLKMKMRGRWKELKLEFD